jgi:CheY-like chemotaxis protein
MAHILVIDDQELIRTMMRTMLTRMRHTVDLAADGKVGLERIQAHPPDLVITDLLMPMIDGFEVIRQLHRTAPSVRIIAMTGGGGERPVTESLRLAQELGATVGLAKPFTVEDLAAAITTALAQDTRPLTFLVLDDHPDSRYLNRCMLEAQFQGCEVLECGTVGDALMASAGHPLDAVITDHHLGESDGSEFVRQLRSRGASCPVIMVTGSSDPKVHARAIAAGASRVFSGGDSDFIGYLRERIK